MALKKVALVTGAARGIGLATAIRFLEDGWQVAMLDILGDTLRSALNVLDRPDAILALEADVSDAAAVQAAVAQTQRRFGRIDALVNNAGIAVFKPMLDVTLEEWQRVLAVNLTGPFLMTQAVAPIMRDQGGGAIVNITSISGLRASTLRVAYGTSKAGLAHLTKQQAAELGEYGIRVNAVAPIMRDQGGGAIVNITSISGLRASTLRVAYGTSKAGLAHLTKQQAAELGEYGIRVNAVAPGPVDTAMAKAVHTPAIRADYHDHIPLNRYGLEQELANAICFLCGDQAGYITGQVLAVDGGFDAAGVGLPTLRRDRRNARPPNAI